MSKCTYCGEKAGLFKTFHKECQEKRESGWRDMLSVIVKSIVDEDAVPELEQRLSKLARESRPIGLCAGAFIVPKNFDAPLPEELLDAFGGR